MEHFHFYKLPNDWVNLVGYIYTLANFHYSCVDFIHDFFFALFTRFHLSPHRIYSHNFVILAQNFKIYSQNYNLNWLRHKIKTQIKCFFSLCGPNFLSNGFRDDSQLCVCVCVWECVFFSLFYDYMVQTFLSAQCLRLRTVPPFPWQPRARSTSPGSREPMAARPSRPSAWSTDAAAALSGWWPLITSRLSNCRWKFATWSPVICNRATQDPK